MFEQVKLVRGSELERVVREAFPNYRKKSVYVQRNATHMGLYDLNWSGGTRKEYRLVTYYGAGIWRVTQIGDHISPPWNNKDEGRRVALEDRIGVEAGQFCGKDATAHVYIPPIPIFENILK